MEQSDSGGVTRLLLSWSRGERSALDELTPYLYTELRRLAASYLRKERQDHTLQPTALVHEAYLRLVDQTQVESRSRAHFFAIAANLMRQILVDHARRHHALKRGSGMKAVLEEAAGVAVKPQVDFVAVNEALEKLARFDSRRSRVVELRFFGGLTEEEIGEVLGVSVITVKRDWRIARAALHKLLADSVPD
jgi:RNA polymerase sigma factor (TIGR02999 family)